MVISRVSLLLLFSGVCHGLVETCDELKAAFDLTNTQDVVIEIDPNTDIDCTAFTTMSMDSNTLTVETSGDLSDSSGTVNLYEIRFEVTDGAKMFWEPNVHFHGSDNRDVFGGAVFVGDGSTVRFLNDLAMTDISVVSVPEESADSASYTLSGGCVYTDGYFRVDGEATFTRCNVSGGGEASPGPGGALYVGEEGSVLFQGPLEITDVSIRDDDGNNGAGIYNLGKVNIKADAVFSELSAETGGAIFNGENAVFRFKKNAKAFFSACSASHDEPTALNNQGYFKFSGAAEFVDMDAPSIITYGELVLSADSVFYGDDGISSPAVIVGTGGDLTIPSSVSFIDDNTVESECTTVYYYEDGTCL